MGIAPVPATKKVLERTGLSLTDFDVVEINEAFAAQVLACLRELPIARDRVNVDGGGIALGHPLGCSGARIAGHLVYEMRRRGVARGLATMCIGVGQGIAGLFELI
jgi:acetyl-CoA C-acetyltransferase/3-oxo-5,6-didehydrosuberyl-CoA/3-oxoadipyl-CoA thiolase